MTSEVEEESDLQASGEPLCEEGGGRGGEGKLGVGTGGGEVMVGYNTCIILQ